MGFTTRLGDYYDISERYMESAIIILYAGQLKITKEVSAILR